MRLTSLLMSSAVALAFALAPQAQAATYNFTVVENNSALDFSNQLRLEVTDTGEGAKFTFFNDVGIASSIGAIYFDDMVPRLFLDPIALFGQSEGVLFKQEATPANLPGGNTLSPTFYADDSGGAVRNIANGVNAAGEWVSFLGLWASGGSFDALINAINSGEFRVGVHLQALPDGQSETYVTPPAVPLPAAVWLFGSALLGFVTLSNRRKV